MSPPDKAWFSLVVARRLHGFYRMNLSSGVEGEKARVFEPVGEAIRVFVVRCDAMRDREEGTRGISGKRFLFKQIADNRLGSSLATSLRRRRFALFKELVSSLNRPFSILDVGGTPRFWEKMGFAQERGVRIVLLNVGERGSRRPNLASVTGDARDMGEFGDGSFDVVFSNSVIEHVGDYDEQRRMAGEVTRVGKRYFLQTPNRYFPIEPHFVFPLFQFLPRSLKIFLVRRFDLGWFKRTSDKRKAAEIVDSIRLLTEREVSALFPEGTIRKEKLLGLTKSFMVYGGWGKETNV